MASAKTKPQAPTRLELLISCTQLANLDMFSKTDPMCVLFVKQFGQWKEVGRTEAVRDQLNPKFTETFVLNYDNETNQQLLMSVYDVDSRSHDLRKHDFVGSTEITLHDLVHQDHQQLSTTSRSLRVPGDPQSRGWIHISAEFLHNSRAKFHLYIGGKKLDKAGMFARSKMDTFVEVCRGINSVDFHPVYRSEVVFKSQSPRWRPFEVSLQKLCNGDRKRQIRFSCYQLASNRMDEVMIGETVTSVSELLEHKMFSHVVLPLIKPRNPKKKKKKRKSKGVLKFYSIRLDTVHTLLDFVQGGCSLKFMAAIDFTSSNGPPPEKTSLHHLEGPQENQYIEVIRMIGGMLTHYATDKSFAAYGFGAVVPGKKRKKGCFSLLGNNQLYVKGIQGIIDAYTRQVPLLQFSGPTYLAPVISEATRHVAQRPPLGQERQEYHILMIITDGVINDIDATIDAAIASVDLPMSIIIIGVGPSEFATMDVFNGSLPLKSSSSSLVATRNNVYFAAASKRQSSFGHTSSMAKDCLAAVSKHLTDLMRLKQISPGPLLCSDFKASPLDPLVEEQETAPHQGDLGNTFCAGDSTGPACPTCGSILEQKTTTNIDLSLKEALHCNDVQRLHSGQNGMKQQ